MGTSNIPVLAYFLEIHICDYILNNMILKKTLEIIDYLDPP